MCRLFLILSAFLSFFVEAQTISSPLVVGMELAYPPFETIDTQGNPKGISVELAYALGRYLDRPVSIENIPFIGLIPSLKIGRIDLIISSLTITPLREKVIDFSDPYIETGLALLIGMQSDLESIDQADQPQRVLVVKQGTTGEVYAKSHIKQAKVLILDRESACVLEVIQGKADAFIYDQMSIFTNWQKNRQATRANLQPFHKEYWAIGIRKGNEALKTQVNSFLAEFKKQKGFQRLADEFLPEQEKAFKQMGIPFFL